MGQQKDESTLSDPLGLTTADELVNDALGCVREIPKLSFPDHKGVGVGHWVTKFETWPKRKRHYLNFLKYMATQLYNNSIIIPQQHATAAT